MYTGIVEATGEVERLEAIDRGHRIEIATRTEGLTRGGSVGVSGVCLTATRVGEGWFEADLSGETVTRTTLGTLGSGDSVNVERPLPATGRFDGHVVKGTVDTTTAVVAVEERDDGGWTFTFAIPEGYGRYLVERGAVTLDGVGLTVAALDDSTFDVAVVPITYRETTLSALSPGDPVNFEADVFAKYVDRQRRCDADAESRGGDGR